MRHLHYLTYASLLSLGIACQSADTSTVPGGEGGSSTAGSGASSGEGASMSNGVGGAVGSGGSAGSGGNTGGVVINEIMFDSKAVSDELGEWIELYNPGDAAVDLSGWTLRDQGSNTHTIGSLSIAAGQYLVLGRNGSSANGNYDADYVYGEDFKLSNDGDAVVVEDGDGNTIDSVTYGVSAPWPLKTAGVSFELSTETADTSDGANWQLAVQAYGDGDLGTPGMPNGGAVEEGYTIDDAVSWHQPALETSLHFAPLDDLESIVLEQLATAKTQVRMAFFNVRLPAVKNLLIQHLNNGVDVHVILDKKQQDLSYNTMGEELAAAGVPVTMVENTSAENATMHNKFTVIDGELVMMGSANYSYTALNISDEDLVTMKSSDLAGRYLEEFDEILVGGDEDSDAYPADTPIQAWMGPEDGLRNHVIDQLDAAQSTAVVAMFDVNTNDIRDALIDAHGRGVNVAIVLDQVQADEVDALTDEQLTEAGIPVLLAENTASNAAEMHSKFLVVDHQTVVMGSFNWTNLGSFYNDESIVVIDDAHLAARVEGKFADLLSEYGGSASEMGLATGDQTVSFSLTNVTIDPDVHITIESIGGGPFATPVKLTGTSLDAVIEAGTRVTYRYKIHNTNGPLLQESGTHAFTVPFASGPFQVTDAFLK